MKRDFLKSLGIEDKDTIDAILDENSSDIGKVKGELDTYKEKVTKLEGDIAEKDGKIATLEQKAGDIDSLTQQVTQLRTEKTELETRLSTEVSKIQKAHAIEGGVRDAKAKNVKAVMALLDMDKITFENGELAGLTEQLDTLTKGEDTAFLFGTMTSPAGTTPNTPPAGSGGTPPTSKSLSDSIAKALGTN